MQIQKGMENLSNMYMKMVYINVLNLLHMVFKYDKYPQEENCQFLSITIPKNINKDCKIPVMVWIHGGSYMSGGCDNDFYNRELITKEQCVVSVGINYRLGVLGFVKDREGNFANNGILDIIEGLKWVKKNISAFGGDPDNITIYGESAGGDAVRCVILSEGTDNLYNRAIIQSDPIGTMENREKMEKKMLDELNKLPLDASIEDIKKTEISIINNVTERGNAKYMIFGPHFGVYPLPKHEDIPKKLKEVASNHDLFIGNTTREISCFVGPNKILAGLNKLCLTGMLIESIIKKISRELFHDPTETFAKEYAKAGGKVYRYVFSWGEKKSFIGASHTSELLLLFGGKPCVGRDMALGYSEEELIEIGKPIRKIWGDFAKTG
eukprot:jgi/Orpsp1_1/1191672/evm.model.d7180000087682.1